jgi:uncharacterized protein
MSESRALLRASVHVGTCANMRDGRRKSPAEKYRAVTRRSQQVARTGLSAANEMIYLDTSCLLKLLREEPESAEVRRAVNAEDEVVVSSLTELETEVQLKAAAVGGEIRTSQLRQYQARLAGMRNVDSFHFRHLPAAVFQTALRQHRHPQAAYYRSLDRLHLAAMEELKQTRLMTLDEKQAEAAEALGHKVVRPGRG